MTYVDNVYVYVCIVMQCLSPVCQWADVLKGSKATVCKRRSQRISGKRLEPVRSNALREKCVYIES